MYFISKIGDIVPQGPVQEYGSWSNFLILYVDPEHEKYIDLSKVKSTIINEEVAKAWKFANVIKDYVKVRKNTPNYEQIFAESNESDNEKIEYYLTDEDKNNTVNFLKTIMKIILHDHYDLEFEKLRKKSSFLEMSTWEQQKKEAADYSADASSETPIISILANSRGISVSEFVQLVNNNVLEYNTSMAELLAKQQIVSSEIKSCVTVKDCTRLMHNRFGYSMQLSQKEEEGIDTEPKFDL